MKSSLSLGNLMGIPFGINYSWFVIFLFVSFILAHYYFPATYPKWSTPVYWVVGLSTSLLFFASVVVHELAHSSIAVRSGITVKSITLYFFGGVARISREATRPATELLMATAGPLSSVALAGPFALVWLLSRNTLEPLAAMSYYLCWINLALAVFNMVPGFPMDGGRVLRSIIWWVSGNYMRATRIASLVGQVMGYLLILSGVPLIFLVEPRVWGLWAAFIGVFLSVAASASYRQEVLRDRLRSISAQDVMTHDCPRVPADLALEAVVNEHFLSAAHSLLLVEERGKPVGVITPRNTKEVSKEYWRITTVGEAMTPIESLEVVSPRDDGLIILERMEEGDTGIVLVMAENRVVGIVERHQLLEFGLDRSEPGR